MFQKLIATDHSRTTSLLRVVLGAIFFAHGAQKMLGWFGGYGFSGTMAFFTGTLHVPVLFAFLAIAAEFFGSLGLLVGLLARVAAFAIGVNMLMAVIMVHHAFGFFMNWSGTQKGEGCEYHNLVLAVTLFLMVQAADAASIDGLLTAEQPNQRVTIPASV